MAAGAVLGMVAAVLAGGSPARAAQHGLAAQADGAGVISTVAGGVGGPGQGRSVSLTPCSVWFADGEVYLADGRSGYASAGRCGC